MGENVTRQRMLRSFRYRNYRLFFGGHGLSLIGTWVQQIAMSWLIYRLTGSALYLGLVNFSAQIPTLLLTPFAGVLADRYDRRRILICTQTLSMLQAATLAVLTLSGHITVWQIIALSIPLGLANALDMPTRQSFMVNIVENREDLGNAIALNSSMFNAARLVGPSMGGLLIPLVGEGGCFLINAVSYLAVLGALVAMRVPPRTDIPARAPVMENLREGFSYVAGFRPLRAIILLLAGVSLVGAPYTVLLPVFAQDVLHGGPRTLGFLMASTGVGALFGALYLASRPTVLGLGRLIVLSSSTFGIGLALLSQARTMWVAVPMMIITGTATILHMASSNTIVQTIVTDDKRGRVMSIYMMAFVGAAPVGSLLAGAVANRVGVPITFIGGGVLCVLATTIFATRLPALREIVRPIYVRIGILPDETQAALSPTDSNSSASPRV